MASSSQDECSLTAIDAGNGAASPATAIADAGLSLTTDELSFEIEKGERLQLRHMLEEDELSLNAFISVIAF